MVVKDGDPHPFVDPATWNRRAKAAQENAASTLGGGKSESSGGKVRRSRCPAPSRHFGGVTPVNHLKPIERMLSTLSVFPS